MNKRSFVRSCVRRLKEHKPLNQSCGECTIDVMEEDADDVEIALVRVGYRIPFTSSKIEKFGGKDVQVRCIQVVNICHN